jgi:phage tail P2-like protein
MADERLVAPGIRDARSIAMEALAARLQEIDLSPLLVMLFDLVDASALPHLAEQFKVTGYDGWLLTSNDDERRALLKKAFQLHRYKGTPWAIKEAIKAVGYADVSVQEHFPTVFRNGSFNRDRSHWRGSPHGQWALFRVIVDLGEEKGLTAHSSDLIKGGIGAYKNLRSWLQHLGFRADVADLVEVDEALSVTVRQGSLADRLLYTTRHDRAVLRDGSCTRDPQADKATLNVRYRPLHNGLRHRNGGTYRGATFAEAL